jgi:cysteine protease ATG4
MTNVDFGRYKRIVQYFWDPEPTNVDGSRLPVWCLGREYALPSIPDNKLPLRVQPNDSTSDATHWDHQVENASSFENISNSFASIPASEVTSEAKSTEEGGWPVAFLDDFEAKIWLTYRSGFPPIARSQDPKALSAMTFSVRLRSQLVDQGGFTSDTGWGCMIRSGQSLLANAILILRLGRGMGIKQIETSC